MRTFSSVFAALCLLAVVGCDDGSASKSGVDRSKYLDELSTNEIRQLCSWTGSLVEPGKHECSNGTTMTTYTVSDCVERAQKDPPPHCRVSLTEDCFSSIDGDPCKVLTTDACMTYIACTAKSTSRATGN